MISNEGDRITGKALMGLLKQLKKDMITLQLILTGRNYERLTVLADLQEAGGKHFVIVDCPEKMDKDVPEYEGAGVKIEFVGKDRVQYSFLSRIVKVKERDLLLEMPDHVKRLQRRRFFRIAPPVGTKVTFSRAGKHQDASLINLSEGGALVLPGGPARGTPRLSVGEELKNVSVRCSAENLRAEIRVKKAVVIREQADTGSERAAYALEFLELDSRDRRMLEEFIFICQREIIRKRNESGRGELGRREKNQT